MGDAVGSRKRAAEGPAGSPAKVATGSRMPEGDKPHPECFSGQCTLHLENGFDDGSESGSEGGSDTKEKHVTRTCWHMKCAASTCDKSVCVYHGWGDGQNEGSGSDVDELSYNSRCCAAPDCKKYFCQAHYYEMTSPCDVCSRVIQAEANLGMYNRADPVHFCGDHAPVRCEGKIPGKADSESEVCGLMCCAQCLGDHRCGFNPSDYI